MTRLIKTLAVVLMLGDLAACGPSDGSPGDRDVQSTGDGSTGATPDGASRATADGGACKPVTPSAAAQQFIGAWRLVAGTTNCTCSGGQAESTSADGTDIETFTAGCGADQVIGFDANVPCPETCTVSGTVATCQPFTCLVDGVEVQSTHDVYTLLNGQLDEAGGGLVSGSGVSCQCASSDDVLQRVQ
jgi:hypothetical protein